MFLLIGDEAELGHITRNITSLSSFLIGCYATLSPWLRLLIIITVLYHRRRMHRPNLAHYTERRGLIRNARTERGGGVEEEEESGPYRL